MFSTSLNIGGYTLRVAEKKDFPLLSWPNPFFEPFAGDPDSAPDIDLEIEVTERLPSIQKGSPLFDACEGHWKLWEYDSKNFFVETSSPKTKKCFTCGFLTKDFRKASLWTLVDYLDKDKTKPGWSPSKVLNPVGEICLVTRLAREGGFLLHGAGIEVEGEGWIFTGPSEAGKSTLSKFFFDQGYTVYTDEKTIVRRLEGIPVVMGSPWPGEGYYLHNGQIPLSRLHFIRHGKNAHEIKKLSPALAATQLIQLCFLPYWDREAMDQTLAFIRELVQAIDCFELAPLKTPDVVNYLKHFHAGVLA